MKKILVSLLLFVLILGNIGNVNAVKIQIINKVEINREYIFNFFADYYRNNTPKSYKYININFKGIKKDSKIEKSLQILVYNDLIPNIGKRFYQNKNMNAWYFFRLSEKIFNIKINDAESKSELKNRDVTLNDLNSVKRFLENKPLEIKTISSNKKIKQKQAIFKDVYETILNGHYDKNTFSESDIIDSAISGIAKGTGDKFTVYFPPIDSKSFYDSLAGEYEGIGSYVDMEEPGVLKIISPIPGSPSEKAGLKGGDIVLKVDDKEITKKNSLSEVVSWIKGPAGSIVRLYIKRGNKNINIDVTREKIVLKDVEYKTLNNHIFYLQIKSFGNHVSLDFKEALDKLKKNKRIDRIIIDLRNNGGGYLGEVTEMLSYFVKKGEKTAVVKYNGTTKNYISKGYDYIDFSKYTIVVLQNSGTASASEIMIGTLKDYFSNLKIIGEKSYGKGSVQAIKQYNDGSSLKYTVAKWFTGGTETGINHIGIKPTEILELDIKRFKANGYDNQLERAKYIK